jgi:hypothetical protein
VVEHALGVAEGEPVRPVEAHRVHHRVRRCRLVERADPPRLLGQKDRGGGLRRKQVQAHVGWWDVGWSDEIKRPRRRQIPFRAFFSSWRREQLATSIARSWRPQSRAAGSIESGLLSGPCTPGAMQGLLNAAAASTGAGSWHLLFDI